MTTRAHLENEIVARTAARKGYALATARMDASDGPRRIVAADPVTSAVHAAADDWPGIMRFLRHAPPLGDADERIATAAAEIETERSRR